MVEPRRLGGGGYAEPREGHWFAEPRPVRRTLRKMPSWYAWFWAPMVYRIVGRMLGVTVPRWLPEAEAAGWLLLLLLAAWWFVAERIALRRTSADRNFSDRPPGLQEFPLEIVVQRNGEEIGMDRGLAWFEDGLLYFNGTATSFVLSRLDLAPRNKWKLEMSDEPKGYLELKVPHVRAAIKLLPLGGWRRVRFWIRFRKFFSESPNRAARRQWPPLLTYGVQEAVLVGRRQTPEEIGVEAARSGSATGVVRS